MRPNVCPYVSICVHMCPYVSICVLGNRDPTASGVIYHMLYHQHMQHALYQHMQHALYQHMQHALYQMPHTTCLTQPALYRRPHPSAYV